ELASKNDKIIGITPAMPTGSSLKFMMDKFPARAFDVGIAEQHAVTFAAGLVAQGMTVFCNIYSTFLQRAYDQVIHDVCLQKIPVIFCLDRAGSVGEDGATHHGIFDLAYLNCIPNLILFAPRNEIELRNIMFTAQTGLDLPIFIRYPRGHGKILNWQKAFRKIEIGTAEIVKHGSEIVILTIGTMAGNTMDAIEMLPLEHQNKIGCVDIRFLKPLDEALLHQIFQKYKACITIEDGTIIGGLGATITAFASKFHYLNKIEMLGVDDFYPEHGSVFELQEIAGISARKIKERIESFL